MFGDIQRMPYVELQSLNDAILGPGACNYTKGGYLGQITSDCIEALIDSARRLPSPLSVVEFSYQHAAQDRLAEDDTAFPDRHADHFINVLARWHPDDEWQPHIDWARDTFAATSRWQTGGVYSNFLAVDDDSRVRHAYRGGKYQRLATIKAKFDPDNVFNSNPNIKPCAALAN